jgi:hypothetical protein
MKSGLAILTTLFIVSALVAVPTRVHGQQAAIDQQHDYYHPDVATAPEQTPGSIPPQTPAAPDAPGVQSKMMTTMNRMKRTGSELDALVKTMNAATGQSKVDAMAELLTALVADWRCDAMMAEMKSMMTTMRGPMMNRAMPEGEAQTPKK